MLKPSSSFPSPCFRPSTITDDNDTHPPSTAAAPPQPISGKPNVTSCVYQTPELGLVSFTWYTNVLGRSLQIDFRLPNSNNEQQSSSSSAAVPCCFNLHIQPILFWRRKNGCKTFTLSNNDIKASSLQICWNFSRAKFSSDHPEPKSGFFVSLVLDGVMILLVGDSYNKTKTDKHQKQVLVLRREHVFASRFYSTKVKLGGKTRDVSIDCRIGDNKDDKEARLCFSIDGVEVIGIKRLKWKFRGNQKVVIDGKYPVHVSWDVYNWLFKSSSSSSSSSPPGHGHGVNGGNAAVFMFRFENPFEFEEEMVDEEKVKMVGCGFGGISKIGFKKRSGSSSMSSSMSPSVSSSSCSTTSSVMEWANIEDTELDHNTNGSSPGFSLLIYAWKN